MTLVSAITGALYEEYKKGLWRGARWAVLCKAKQLLYFGNSDTTVLSGSL
jgi:hypothetical protein